MTVDVVYTVTRFLKGPVVLRYLHVVMNLQENEWSRLAVLPRSKNLATDVTGFPERDKQKMAQFEQ